MKAFSHINIGEKISFIIGCKNYLILVVSKKNSVQPKFTMASNEYISLTSFQGSAEVVRTLVFGSRAKTIYGAPKHFRVI